MSTDVETELVKVTKVKPDKYTDRQDFLAAILKAMEKLSDDDFDNLSDEAAHWHSVIAVPAFVAKEEIPDFNGNEEAEVAEPEDETADEPDVEAEAEKPTKKKAAKAKGKTAKAPGKEPKYRELSGEKDEFGVVKGTKTSQAVAMYVKGASTNEIKEELGGRFYNILKKLKADGHKVEKLENGKWKLTHKGK